VYKGHVCVCEYSLGVCMAVIKLICTSCHTFTVPDTCTL